MGEVSCSLSTDSFALNPTYRHEYSLTVNSNLDRETKAEVKIVVTCTDGAPNPKTSQAELEVRTGALIMVSLASG